jgi:hypothetical protein
MAEQARCSSRPSVSPQEGSVIGRCEQHARVVLDPPECLAHRAQIGLSLRGKLHLPVLAVEEASSEELLPLTDLMADRARRHAELLGRCREAQVTASGFEGAEATERRQAGENRRNSWLSAVKSHDTAGRSSNGWLSP